MIRRCIAILLLAAYSVGQLAAIAHVHAAEPAGHAVRAHFHLNTEKHDHEHDHEHDHGHGPGGRHSHAQPSAPAPASSVPAEHDDNCIFLPDPVTPGTQAKVELPEVDAVGAAYIEAPYLLLASQIDLNGARLASTDILRSGCDLCLMLRTLRI